VPEVTGEGPRGWGDPLYEAVLDATAVGPGTRVLDLGCGSGALARAAVGRGARVTGLDADPAAVAQAAAEVPGADFFVGEAMSPPPGPFDVVVAAQLLMHVADPVAVLAAAGRCGKAVAATVWGRQDECDVRVFGEALSPWLGPRGAPPGPPITAPDRLRAAAEQAGLVVERLEEVVCRFDYADEEEVLGPLIRSALGRAVVRRSGPVALRAAVLRALEPYRTATGGFGLDNLFRVLVAQPTSSTGPAGGVRPPARA
jgi:SAM-dependent methyltransferase